MKKRSEVTAEKKVLKKRSEVKSSAAERTVDMFDENTIAHCNECNTDMRPKDLKKRGDGKLECNTCAAPVKLVPGPAKTESKADPKADGKDWTPPTGPSSETEERIRKMQDEAIAKTRAAAKQTDPVSTRSDTETSKSGPFVPGEPSMTFSGNRVHVTWGKATFPIGEVNGVKYANKEIGIFTISEDVPPGGNRVEVAKEIIEDLRQIANLAFDAQLSWYIDKLVALGIIEKPAKKK